MMSKFSSRSLLRAAGAAVLLGAALAVWGLTPVTITLTDGTNTLTCTVPSGTDTHDSAGNISATVDPGCLGFSVLTVSKTGTGASVGTVVSTAPAGGINCGADCTEPYNNGTQVTLAANTPAGVTFTGWSGGGCTGTGTCAVTITAATTVTADFTAPPTLTVVKAGTGSGTITGTGISCGTGTIGDCTELYGSAITLTATPGTASTFAGWSGGGCSGTGLTCTPTLAVSGTVTATFNGSCNTPPAAGRAVTVVETGSITTNWPQRTFSPLPSSITAFHVNVPSGFVMHDNILAIKGSTSARAPMMILSTQPGCADPFNAQAYCKISGLDTSTIKASGNLSDVITYCRLPPGDYYVNAFNQATVGGVYTCTDTTTCTFYASRSTNY